MKKRKKDTGLSLQASISEKEKKTVTSGFLAIVPVCYMILGVFGWMKTALGIINVVYDADLLYIPFWNVRTAAADAVKKGS